jgi:hypothetical protein
VVSDRNFTRPEFTGSRPRARRLRVTFRTFSRPVPDPLLRVIADPDGHALRLARSLRRLQKNGEPRPAVGPATSAFRLWARLPPCCPRRSVRGSTLGKALAEARLTQQKNAGARGARLRPKVLEETGEKGP